MEWDKSFGELRSEEDWENAQVWSVPTRGRWWLGSQGYPGKEERTERLRGFRRRQSQRNRDV